MKANHYLCVLAVLCVISCLLIAGCTQTQKPGQTTTPPTEYQTQSPTVRQPVAKDSFSSDADRYFPMKVGSEWLYKVDVEKNGAVIYKATPFFIRREMVYPQDKGNNLRIKIEKTVDKQCGSQYPGSLQLKVIEDNFGIFKYDKEIFWIKLGLSSLDTYMVNQVTTVTDSYYGETCAERVLFIADEVNTGMSRSGSKDELVYLGEERISYKYHLIDCMHFRRTVGASEKASGDWGKEFTEDSWYAPDKGLIRMEQKIAGRTSMVWELESFKSG
jgi:hypothetical protein